MMTSDGITPATDAESMPQLFGHPAGLFTLFFAEMWERFSYYGMRALLLFYMTKGFLGYGDTEAYGVYGAYTALVYMTPYFGGMLADRLLGPRRAVVMGGLLMAAGHLLMTVEQTTAFFVALALLIAGNGFFKPNISTMVGGIYPKHSTRRDAGFTLFYMGINLGAALSPIVCGYIGETYGWHYGFGLATCGMLIGVAIFVAPTRLTQLLILGSALATSVAMPMLQDTALQLGVRLFMSVALTTAAVVAFVALGRGGVPRSLGAPRDPAALSRRLGGLLRADHAVYLGTVLAIPLFALLLQRDSTTAYVLAATGAAALGYILYEAVFACGRVERHRLYVVLILTFFSLLFWAFFEQAGSSLNNFTDRNVDRVLEERRVTATEVGARVEMRIAPRGGDGAATRLPALTQEQLGYASGDGAVRDRAAEALRREDARREKPEPDKIEEQVRKLQGQPAFTMTEMTALRTAAGRDGAPPGQQTVSWRVTQENVGMGLGGAEIPASEFQAVNPICIMIFGLLFSALWGFLGARGLEPSTPVKFALGLLQLGLGFGVIWYGARQADTRGMVGMSWLLLGYLLHTTGELCLSPVGLSMITRLSPARLVSTLMGAWFLATAFSQYLAGVIATFTGVSEGGEQVIPPPAETVHVYGGVFGTIALTAIASALVCFALSPLLRRWMHAESE